MGWWGGVPLCPPGGWPLSCVGCVLGVSGFLGEIFVSCGSEGGLSASGHAHVCWVVQGP